jgi:hypothetical protein
MATKRVSIYCQSINIAFVVTIAINKRTRTYLTSVLRNSLKIVVSVSAAIFSGSPDPSGGVSFSSAFTISSLDRIRVASVVDKSLSLLLWNAGPLLVDLTLMGAALRGAFFAVGVEVGEDVKLLEDEERESDCGPVLEPDNTPAINKELLT